MKHNSWEIRKPGDSGHSLQRRRHLQRYSHDTEETKSPKGFLPKNPGFRIMLYDVILILFIAIVFIPVSRRVLSSSRDGDGRFKMTALEYENTLIVTLKFSAKKKLADKNDISWNESFKVSFYYKDDILGETLFYYPSEDDALPVFYRSRYDSRGWDAIMAKIEFSDGSSSEMSCLVMNEEKNEKETLKEKK